MFIKSTGNSVFVDLTEGRELIINGIAISGYWGSQHVICLVTNRPGVGSDGTLQCEAAIVARLRFDTAMAKQFRDALDAQIASLAPPPQKMTN